MKQELLDPDKKCFMWLQNRSYGRQDAFAGGTKSNKRLFPTYGPRGSNDQELIGRSRWHTEEQILSLPLSASKRKRVSSMRVGTIIDWEYSSLNNWYHLKRMSEEEIQGANSWISLNNELHQVNEVIKESIPDLLKAKNKLSSKISKEKKKLEKKGVL